MGSDGVVVSLEDGRLVDGEDLGKNALFGDGVWTEEVDYGEVLDISSDVDDGISDSSERSLNSNASESWVTRSWTSPRRGLEHCDVAAVRSNSCSLLVKGSELTLPRSKIGRNGSPMYNLRLDRLSEREKRKIIENLVKIQSNGKVEVDVAHTKTVAADLLELDAFGSTPDIEDAAFQFSKSIPRLKIVMLVVGTRGDVQPFIALAKKLQASMLMELYCIKEAFYYEFGHHVRLATHMNFCSFVRSCGVEFYHLGGDPRIMAGYVARNKGFMLSGPAEINVQRKQLKEIIDSLLPACTAPDLITGRPFKAQAIIANPPAYGHLHVAEALGVPLHIFFTMPWTPTNEFPHPFARVPQSAVNRLSYLIMDLLVWWGIRGYVNEFRKRKLKLPPIAYFSTYHGSISHLPTGYMWSPHLVPKPNDWGPLVDVVGFCFLNLATKYQPEKEFMQWLQNGPSPIYIGFGSVPLEDAKKTTSIILEALKETGQRGIISRGWGDLGNLSEMSVDVYLLGDCPHDWLFPKCAAVVSIKCIIIFSFRWFKYLCVEQYVKLICLEKLTTSN
ncbi:sterol 3-beta-glucosyltransferase UGT80B1 isoform X2 [Canna indica]|uniref:Sterol 3-beta-glucosyltransferase UGT80B1 isoform X2 n=1 Tax=Canna indica TaxID=4628 RepID=A0AAQ3Q1M0_9LILI|nr:sterol 3-beta-glucosyltransferase UGT80B1 isoform X2 [Canna indica]